MVTGEQIGEILGMYFPQLRLIRIALESDTWGFKFIQCDRFENFFLRHGVTLLAKNQR